MGYSNTDAIAGNQQIAPFGLPDTTPRHQPGLYLSAIDNYWGAAEMMYLRASANIRQFGVCFVSPVQTATGYRYDATEMPIAVTNLGIPLMIAMTTMTAGQYGWFLITGTIPVNSTASFIVGAAVYYGAGQLTPQSNGRQVNGARCVATAATTVVKNGQANANSSVLTISGSDGWFIGLYLSGTGIAAGTVIVDIDASGTRVVLSTPTTAIVGGPITGTYNNGTVFYNVCHFNRPSSQGQIT